MNLVQSSKFFNKTDSLPKLKKQMYKYQPNVWESTTAQIMNSLRDTPKQLPFLIKVRLIQSIKTTSPIISYHYTHPKNRLLKNLKYSNFLSKNYVTTDSVSCEFFVKSLLKI